MSAFKSLQGDLQKQINSLYTAIELSQLDYLHGHIFLTAHVPLKDLLKKMQVKVLFNN